MSDTRLTSPQKKAFSNSHLYEQARLLAREYVGAINSKLQSGDGNSNYGNMWIKNPLTRESMRIRKGESIPEGWIEGRFVSKEIGVNETKRLKAQKNRVNRYIHYAKLLKMREYQNLYGWDAACKKFGYTSSEANYTQSLRRFRNIIDCVLPYCEGKTKEEILEILKPRQGTRSVNG